MLATVWLIPPLLLAAPPTGAAASTGKNFLLIAVDDLRPEFGDSFGNAEVLTPHMDKHFTNGGGSAMQHSYVQIAVCGPSRASILTGRRPDTTTCGTNGNGPRGPKAGWCWCQRTQCDTNNLFMTLPTWFAQHGYVTAGNGKIFHPDACTLLHKPDFGPHFAHRNGDDGRAWNHGRYGVEGHLRRPFSNFTTAFSQEQWGTIPGPEMAVFNNTHGGSVIGQGLDWMRSPLSDEEQTDGQIATHTIERLGNFSRDGIGKTAAPTGSSSTPFFLATGFHKPHTPWIVPTKYFELYDVEKISLAPNPYVPSNFKEENWHHNGNLEIEEYANGGAAGTASPFLPPAPFGFNQPVDNRTARELRHAYFAATSFLDAQVGRVMDALESYGYLENTAVALWSDHGYHLGDQNSWCKMTNFEHATRNTLLWRVPGQTAASQGRNARYVEMLDFFPTVVELMGLPRIPECTGIDQPPSVLCLQGKSYADEFIPALARKASGVGRRQLSTAKSYIFSQWPYPARFSPGKTDMRMGYTVRTDASYRMTQYVVYNLTDHTGYWNDAGGSDDLELYDYNSDPHETTNQAANPKYAGIVKQLQSVLKQQFDSRQ